MDDVRTVAGELHRLAENEPLGAFDTAELLERGRRGRRRRKLFTAGGAIAGVAAIALAVGLLPNLGSAASEPPVSGDQTQNSLFEPVPGWPRGEAGAGQKLTKEEATRRCDLRYPQYKGKTLRGSTFSTGQSAMYDIKIGEKDAMCNVPGGDKPIAALVRAAMADPVPTTAADQLRNCSVRAWVDLTGWRVVASDQSKRLATTILIAISPSGRKAIACELDPIGPYRSEDFNNSQFLTLGSLGPNDPVTTPGKGAKHADLFAGAGGGGGYCPGTACTKNYNFTGWGRVSSTATKVSIKMGSDPAHVVPVTDGWFALTYVSKADQSTVKNPPTITAYDKHGKIVKIIQH